MGERFKYVGLLVCTLVLMALGAKLYHLYHNGTVFIPAAVSACWLFAYIMEWI